MSKKIVAITSMNEDYYNLCGRTFLRSYKKYWSHIMPLYVYKEGLFDIKVKSVNELPFDLGNEYTAFIERHSNSKIKKFAKKAYSIIHAMRTIECDRLIWLDADTVITASIPAQLLDLISPDDVLSTHYDVWHSWPSDTDPDRIAHSCETGFFMLNKKHKAFWKFHDRYADIYNNDECSDIRRFYDGEVYGKTVKQMEEQGFKMLNLNPGQHKTPISRSVLAPYLSHYKAGLKERLDQDQIVENFDLEDD